MMLDLMVLLKGFCLMEWMFTGDWEHAKIWPVNQRIMLFYACSNLFRTPGLPQLLWPTNDPHRENSWISAIELNNIRSSNAIMVKSMAFSRFVLQTKKWNNAFITEVVIQFFCPSLFSPIKFTKFWHGLVTTELKFLKSKRMERSIW